MFPMKGFLLLTGFFFSIAFVSAQQENVWTFGKLAGVDFNNGAPTAIVTAIDEGNFLESCASVSDKNGQLLFYTGGSKI